MQTLQLWRAPTYTGTAADLNHKVAALNLRLQEIAGTHAGVRFATSLGPEDMLLTDVLLRNHIPIQIFTLNTGRLNAETVALLPQIKTRYSYAVQTIEPDSQSVEKLIEQQGLNGFYDSLETRKACCQVRKIEPLNRALQGADAWITGQRREQSATRTELLQKEHDSARNIAKYNPLFDWTEAEVWGYLTQHGVPVNALHAKGYASIGCEPCSRAIKADEDVRAGRWWWEQKDSKECGLHDINLKSEK